MVPVDAGQDPETLRRHTQTLREQPVPRLEVAPPTPAATISISVDSTFIRRCEESERHLEVRIGNTETDAGGRQVFGVVAGSEEDLVAVIDRALSSAGRTEAMLLTGFTDGCAGPRLILTVAGVTEPAILDWFHIAIRL